MNKAEAIEILTRIMNNNFYGGEVQTACKMGIEALSLLPIPSNLDEAAEEYAYKTQWDHGVRFDAFKAGAEWMAGQFQKIDGDLVDWYSTSDGKDYCCGIKTQDAFEVPEGFYIKKK